MNLNEAEKREYRPTHVVIVISPRSYKIMMKPRTDFTTAMGMSAYFSKIVAQVGDYCREVAGDKAAPEFGLGCTSQVDEWVSIEQAHHFPDKHIYELFWKSFKDAFTSTVLEKIPEVDLKFVELTE